MSGAGVGNPAAVDEVPGKSRVRRGDAHITLRREFSPIPTAGPSIAAITGFGRDSAATSGPCRALRPATTCSRPARSPGPTGPCRTERPGTPVDHHVRGIVLAQRADGLDEVCSTA